MPVREVQADEAPWRHLRQVRRRGDTQQGPARAAGPHRTGVALLARSEEHTSELQSRLHLVCRLLLEKKKKKNKQPDSSNTKMRSQNRYKRQATSLRETS